MEQEVEAQFYYYESVRRERWKYLPPNLPV
jgi:hypothetical protein